MEDDVWLAVSKAIYRCYQTHESLIVLKDGRVCGTVFQRHESLSLVVTFMNTEEEFHI